jgi:hypothetical protein
MKLLLLQIVVIIWFALDILKLFKFNFYKFKMKQISSKHPAVKITLANYENLVSTLKHSQGNFQITKSIRSLVYGVLVKEVEWDNAKVLYSHYSEESSACLGMLE